jgi:hypothetical protein
MQSLGRAEDLAAQAVGDHDVVTDAKAVHRGTPVSIFRIRSVGLDDRIRMHRFADRWMPKADCCPSAQS